MIVVGPVRRVPGTDGATDGRQPSDGSTLERCSPLAILVAGRVKKPRKNKQHRAGHKVSQAQRERRKMAKWILPSEVTLLIGQRLGPLDLYNYALADPVYWRTLKTRAERKQRAWRAAEELKKQGPLRRALVKERDRLRQAVREYRLHEQMGTPGFGYKKVARKNNVYPVQLHRILFDDQTASEVVGLMSDSEDGHEKSMDEDVPGTGDGSFSSGGDSPFHF